MKNLIKLIVLALPLLVISCRSNPTMLYIERGEKTTSMQTNYTGVLSPKEQEKIIRYLERRTSKPIVVVGKDKSIYSYREFCVVMNIKFPSVLERYNVRIGSNEIEGMDYKDIWLSKGPPQSIFVTDDSVTWKYKDDSLIVFFEGKALTIN